MAITRAQKQARTRKVQRDVASEMLPQFEQFLESREAYIKALETTIEALHRENQQYNRNNLAIRSSIDELVAMQRLSNIISTAVEPDVILKTLVELTEQVVDVLEANIFLFDVKTNRLAPLSPAESPPLMQEALNQLESGIVDWVFGEMKTVVIPDLDTLSREGTGQNFVIVPLLIQKRPVGIYLLRTTKTQQDFSNHDIQLLSVLANQAAAGVVNWMTYQQLHQANEELKVSRAQMVQAAKLAAIGELAAGILHEIKNPVQVLMMYNDVVQRGRQIPNLFELLSAQIKRLGEITRRLTTFSRNVTEDMKMEPTDINKAVAEMVDMVRHQFTNDKISISLDLADPPPTVMGNVNVLQQVFLNLLINARDAMPSGGTCRISTGIRDLNVVVTIEDTGTGIEPHLLERIFEPFFTTKEEGKGTGLGLSICKNIVSQHQGTIDVKSQVGKGSAFSVILPIRRSVA